MAQGLRQRTGKIVVRELTLELLPDYLRFFDRDAFADNPWWSGCYCGFWDDKCADQDWDAGPIGGPAHRQAREDRIRKGLAHGLLAFVDDKPVGWCNAGPRASYVNLRTFSVAVEIPKELVGSILCFVVAAPFRGKGVASALLDAACSSFRREGLSQAEAYPRTTQPKPNSELPWSAENYHGPLEMYLKNGFTIHRQLERWAIVRKAL